MITLRGQILVSRTDDDHPCPFLSSSSSVCAFKTSPCVRSNVPVCTGNMPICTTHREHTRSHGTTLRHTLHPRTAPAPHTPHTTTQAAHHTRHHNPYIIRTNMHLQHTRTTTQQVQMLNCLLFVLRRGINLTIQRLGCRCQKIITYLGRQSSLPGRVWPRCSDLLLPPRQARSTRNPSQTSSTTCHQSNQITEERTCLSHEIFPLMT